MTKHVINPFSRTNPDRSIVLPVWAAADGVGLQVAALSPFILGVYVDTYQYTLSNAGWLLTLEFSLLAAAALLISAWIDKIPRATVASIGVFIVVLANFLTLGIESFEVMLGVRALSGIGYGVTMAAGNAAAASAHHPARLYGHKLMLFAIYTTINLLLVGVFMDKFGGHALFTIMGSTSLILMLFVRKIPQYVQSSGELSDTRETIVNHPLRAIPTYVFICVFIAMLLFFLRENIVYVVSERFAAELGISINQLTLIYSASTILGIGGPAIAVWVSERLNLITPMCVSVLCLAVLVTVISLTKNPTIYMTGLLLWAPLNLAGFSLLMGIAGVIDYRGRLAAACGAAVLWAYAISPGLSIYLVELGGRPLIALFIWIFASLTILLLLVVKSKFSANSDTDANMESSGLAATHRQN